MLRGGASRVRAALSVLALSAAILAAVPSTTAAQTAPSPATLAEHVPGELIVGFEPSAGAAGRTDALRGIGATSSEPISPLAPYTRVVRFGGMSIEAAITALTRNPIVRYAEPNYVLHANAVSNDPEYVAGSLWGMYGDSSLPTYQFGSQADQAWAAGKTGSRSVYVGIIDTGIMWDHSDLRNNVGNPNENPTDGIDNDGNGYVDDTYGYDFASSATGDNRPQDDNGHGTHVAGTIGAEGGNGIGVAGVAWQVRMLSGKFLGSSGSGSTADAVKALDYFTDLKTEHGLNIVATNNSWGGGDFTNSLAEAIQRGGDAGILFVVAAGNESIDNDATPRYPTSYACPMPGGWDCVVSVASINQAGGLSSFSNWGATSVDLGAPGSSIRSTWRGGGYNTISGTSMATPHVTGAIALCASVDANLTAEDLKDAVISSARSTSSLAGKTSTGGRLDVGSMIGSCGASASSAGRTTLFTTGVTFSGVGSGTVTHVGAGFTCTTTCSYARTGEVFLLASASTGSVFRGWSGCATTFGSLSPAEYCLVYATKARTVTATFDLQTFPFQLSMGKPSGTKPSVSISTSGTNATSWSTKCTTSCKNSALRYGTVVTLTANPVSGATRYQWGPGCDSVSGRTCTVSVNSIESVSITFTV